ncbi:Sulfonamide resistance protein [Thalassovita gelatinovora]|uniref:Bcr/CflA family efflux transporter n=1 Tax=Thalassovita gelatinovora TaxID=53501 RepID=A0A0P1FTI3_THAGE|nr:multidrug effflux MFS transporter [Thalassovita gelatinovora]QIZ80229.1 multidrug effflux MFS transporter [Thalassovita gelatinovora]CUH64091.1 Sulfonamide resistance protein [Thalassovita gelatinovora]SEQ83151.1 MFS transporter, DHA1 family, bicyclomycin/chloramphenicol resistance protein [Thalassovita gelatinovora]
MDNNARVRFLDSTTAPHIVTLISLASISALAMNIFLPSLPGMADYFGVEYGFMQLSVALYLAINAVMQIFVGPLSDKYGRRPVILWGTGLFCLATLGCLLSTSGMMFMIFRMLQAVIAVAIVLSRAVVRDMFPAERAASIMGYVTMGMSLVPMLGPALGGYLETLFSWHASFVLLLICGVALFLLIYFDLGETAQKSGNSLGQQFREYPELLTSPRFWGYSMAAALNAGAFFAYLGGGPFVGTEVFHLTPENLGLYFATPGIGYFLGNFISGQLSARMGINRMILFGTSITSTGLIVSLLITLAGFSHPVLFYGTMVFVGLGNGMTIPNATSGMLSVRPHLAGTASGLGGTMMIGGGAALSALAGVLLSPGTTELPLIGLMATTSIASVLCIRLVIQRERKMGL